MSVFKNRQEAAKLLANKLLAYRDKNPLVLGIPRGAIPMAKVIADTLNGELSAILVHKIPAPQNEEFAIGSVGLSGHIQRMPPIPLLTIEDAYLQDQAKRQLALLRNRQKKYGLPEPNYADRIVVIVEDGIATGFTALSAIYEVKLHHPKKIIVAAAVTARESAEKIRQKAELVVLDEPEFFYAVGQFFENFDQVSDEEVIEIFKNKA